MQGNTRRLILGGLGVLLSVSAALAGRPDQFSRKSPAGETVSRPQPTLKPGEKIIRSSDTIDRKMYDSGMATVDGERAPITVTERDAKVVKVYPTREVTVVTNKVTTRPRDEVVIPRISREEYRRILENYQRGMDEPVELLKTEIEVGEDGVSLDDINKYSNPARRLEDQGIPVETAGSGEKTKN